MRQKLIAPQLPRNFAGIQNGFESVINVVDIAGMLNDLRGRRRQLEETIAVLEQLLARMPATPVAQRGRKSMGPEERKIVSDRIKKYWQNKKEQKVAVAAAKGAATPIDGHLQTPGKKETKITTPGSN